MPSFIGVALVVVSSHSNRTVTKTACDCVCEWLSWLMVGVGGPGYCELTEPSLDRRAWAVCIRKLAGYEPGSSREWGSMQLSSLVSAWVPALTSHNNGLWPRSINQLTIFPPLNCFLAECFSTPTEMQSGHPGICCCQIYYPIVAVQLLGNPAGSHQWI